MGKNCQIVDNLTWIHPYNQSSDQRFSAPVVWCYFSADGFSLCELQVQLVTAEIHSKVDIFPFYLMPVNQKNCI